MQGAVIPALRPEHNLWQPASEAGLSCVMAHERVEPYCQMKGVWQSQQNKNVLPMSQTDIVQPSN